MSEDADCGLLLDVNNVYVTCRNHDLDPREYLEGIPYDRVVQIHLAGHTDKGTHCIDTHDGRVIEAVWELYRDALARGGATATLLEWDAKIPPFEEVHTEAPQGCQISRYGRSRLCVKSSRSNGGCKRSSCIRRASKQAFNPTARKLYSRSRRHRSKGLSCRREICLHSSAFRSTQHVLPAPARRHGR